MVRLHDHPPMVFDQWKKFLPIVIIVFFSLFLFRNYFLKGQVPFPANLFVSTYEPWKSYPVPEYPNGPSNKPMGFDNIRIYFPLKTVAINAIRHFQPPLWNPYNFSGNTILATYQSALFHPLSFLYLILPQIDAWSIIIILQPILAALSMYAFLTVLEFSLSARLIGALTYAMSGFFIVWWEEAYMFTYSAIFLPLALTSVERRWYAALSLALAGSILCGAFQMTFYVFLFTAAWILYRKKHILRFFFCFPTAFLLSSIHLIPSIEAYYYSSRIVLDAKYIFDAYLLPFSQLITLIAPDYFGNPGTYNYFGQGFYHERMIWFGIVPLYFVLIQLIDTKRQKHERFFLIAFLISLSLVLSLPTTWGLLYYLKLPLLSTLTPSRMSMLISFSAAVITAFGIERYWKGIPLRTFMLTTIVFGLTLIGGIAYPLYIHYTNLKDTSYVISLRNLVIPTISIFTTFIVIGASIKWRIYRTAGLVCITVILLFNSYFFAQKFLYFSERRFVYPSVPVVSELIKRAGFNRFWTYENGYIEKNFASQYGIFSPEGYDSIMIRRYAEFLAYANSQGKSVRPDRANALIQSTDHLNEILTDPYRKKIVELLGVRYILQKLVPDKNRQYILNDPADLPTIWKDEKFAIHEYENATSRVQLYADVRASYDILTELFDTNTDIHKTLFLEQKPPYLDVSATGSAKISDFKPNSVSVTTQTNGNMMLFLSDVYYPGWNAYVDGIKTPLYRADYTFRATTVPKGEHTVEFRYEPLSWKLGIIGTAVGIIACILFVLI